MKHFPRIGIALVIVLALVLSVPSLAQTPTPTAAQTTGTPEMATTATVETTVTPEMAITATVEMTVTPEMTTTATMKMTVTPEMTTTATLEATAAATAAMTPTPAPALIPSMSPGALAAFQGALRGIYQNVLPSVVSIQVVQQAQGLNAQPEIPGQSPNQQGPQFQRGQGSGFVWDTEGHIVTNNHVVSGATSVSVQFSDGTVASATVVGVDPDSDLAVIKADVAADMLVPVQMGSSSDLMVGDLAIAIGNPFGLEGTMTVGIVSALGRMVPLESGATQSGSYSIPDGIQTDAAINPGNSGGVLVNIDSQVIGVTQSIISPAGASAGIGFAVPGDIVKQVVPVLIETGSYQHPWLGISGLSLSPEIAQAAGLPAGMRGVLVGEVVPGSPADAAGVQGSSREAQVYGQNLSVGGDVIIAVNGQPVNNFEDLLAYLSRNTKVGDQIQLTVLRDGKEMNLTVTLAARPSSQAQTPPVGGTAPGTPILGISGLSLSPAIAQAMALPAEQQGVLVQSVVGGGPADEAGLQGSFKPVVIAGQRIMIGGDVITAMDGEAVPSVSDLQSMVRAAQPGQTVTLTVLRDGEEVTVEVTLGEAAAAQ